jgi:hypothetical protein
MMVPDRNIVAKMQAYDKDLYIKWNNRYSYFEVWRKCAVGHRLITPVTQSIYFQKAPKKFVQLDERILRWLFDRDTWRSRSPNEHHLENDKRWAEYYRRQGIKRREYFRDVAKDMYHAVKNFYTTKHKSKDGKPKFEGKRKTLTWVKPDSQCSRSGRLFIRTAGNARKYFGDS